MSGECDRCGEHAVECECSPHRGLIVDALLDYYGERCPDFEQYCSCCQAWAKYDALVAGYTQGFKDGSAEREDREDDHD